MSGPPHQLLDRGRGFLPGLEALESKGQTKDELRPIQHNLAALWAKASNHGLPIPATPPRWCMVLSTTHDKPFHQRYPTDAAASSAPNIPLLVVELTALHTLVAQSLQ